MPGFREEVTAHLTTSSGEWLDAIEATMTWMHVHRDETAAAMKTIEANDLWAFLASHIQELIDSRLPSSASATARDVVAQHFALATTAHMAQWMLSGLEVNPSLAIARMRVLRPTRPPRLWAVSPSNAVIPTNRTRADTAHVRPRPRSNETGA